MNISRVSLEVKFLEMLLHIPLSSEPPATCLALKVPDLQVDTVPVVFQQILCLGSPEPLLALRARDRAVFC